MNASRRYSLSAVKDAVATFLRTGVKSDWDPVTRDFGRYLLTALLLSFGDPLVRGASSGEVQIGSDGSHLLLRVDGDADDEWWIESSPDLVTWQRQDSMGTVMSGNSTNATVTAVEPPSSPTTFYRAIRTAGLYDSTLMRTISLTFTQANWQTLLANNYGRDTNLAGTLTFNGRTYEGVGVRYRGNTSYQMGGTKKSVAIQVDHTEAGADIMGFDNLNLNNAAGDESIMREPLYFTIMRRFAVSPAGNFAKLYINGTYWGLYSNAQQEDGQLVKDFFPSNDGDRFRAPNVGGGTGGGGTGGGGVPPGGGGFPPGGGGGGGGFASGTSALSYLGTNIATYKSNYEFKSGDATNAWIRLQHATDVLVNTSATEFPEKIHEVLAVDRWLWFLAVENIFADDDSYFNKGADYMFYIEPESGQLHPIEHDGNESFTAADVQLSPVQGTGNTNRPVINRLLGVPEFRQRYLAHMRTVLGEVFNPTSMNALIDSYSALSKADIIADTKKNFTMTAYTKDITALKSFVRQRYAYLTNHAELKPLPPVIEWLSPPTNTPTATVVPTVTAKVTAGATEGVESVWLYYRAKSYGRFTQVAMFDDGAHGDGAAQDGVYGASTTNYPAGAKVRYYVEARSADAAKAAAFFPAHAEEDTDSYRVGLASVGSSPVVINEIMASNLSTLADPQGEFDDWIELRNLTDTAVDLTGRYLTDDPTNPRKWEFPSGTSIPANGFLIVWADEDGKAADGLHANFKLSASGEELYLIDTDFQLNAVLDSVVFGVQGTDRSYGRRLSDPDLFEIMVPTPGRSNAEEP
ncbi:MAG: CotH kinase family protein [Verrucomicrobiales bacterium]|nr:CotH kinase family protein [Verrucomicrobiales bacterium]